MRHKYLLGIIAVFVLILAVWLVPMALAAAGGLDGQPAPGQTQSQPAPSGSECPFLQAHPWMDPHGSGGSSGAGTSSGGGGPQQIQYY